MLGRMRFRVLRRARSRCSTMSRSASAPSRARSALHDLGVLHPGVAEARHRGGPEHADPVHLVLEIREQRRPIRWLREQPAMTAWNWAAARERPVRRPPRAAPLLDLHQPVERGELVLLDALRGHPRAHALQRGADLVDLQDVLDGWPRDEAAPLRHHLDQPLGLEPLEGLPHRRAAQPEVRRDLVLADALQRAQHAGDDRVLQPVVDVGRPRARRDPGAAPVASPLSGHRAPGSSTRWPSDPVML